MNFLQMVFFASLFSLLAGSVSQASATSGVTCPSDADAFSAVKTLAQSGNESSKTVSIEMRNEKSGKIERKSVPVVAIKIGDSFWYFPEELIDLARDVDKEEVLNSLTQKRARKGSIQFTRNIDDNYQLVDHSITLKMDKCVYDGNLSEAAWFGGGALPSREFFAFKITGRSEQ